MNDKQREFVTAIIKIAFTVIFGGMAGGSLFSLPLVIGHYLLGLVAMLILFILGFQIQGKEK